MLRALILLVFLIGVILLALPFVISSVYIDQRGVTVPGHVFSKREDVVMQDSGWKRSSEVTFEYVSPDTHGPEFFKIHPEGPEFDGFRKGQRVDLHYLRRQDTPTVPFTKTLRAIHALPMVRLADQRALSRLEPFQGRPIQVLAAFAGIAMLLLIWRFVGWRFLGWAIGIGVVITLGWFLTQGFPRPTPAPTVNVHEASGRVKSIGRIEQLFESTQEGGVTADQPIDVVGIEFVPEGKTEPVLGVDLLTPALYLA